MSSSMHILPQLQNAQNIENVSQILKTPSDYLYFATFFKIRQQHVKLQINA